MTGDDFSEMGPIDYLLVEWPERQPTGEAVPHLIDLVDRGLIRILDLAFIAKAEDGSVAALEISSLGDAGAAFAAFEGASSGLLSDEDIDAAGGALRPAPRRPCSFSRIAGPARSRPPCAARAANWSPAGAFQSKPCSPPSTRPRRRPRGVKETVMPGLLRGVARTAVVAGTATAVSNRVSRRQADRWAQQEEPPQAPPPAAAPATQQSTIDQLKELGELKAQGVLTEEEFAAQKAKLLAS